MDWIAMPASPAATMKLVGGDPGLDFVNTVGGRLPAAGGGRANVRADKLGRYSDLVAFGVHAGLLSEAAGRSLRRRGEAAPRPALAVLGRAVAFREALYRTLRALLLARRPEARDLALLNHEIAGCRARERLLAEGAGLRWQWRDDAGLEAPLLSVVRAAAALVTSPELRRLRQCGGVSCGWLFLDRSRNHSRQWCSMEDCGNLSKVRRFRARRARARAALR